MITFTQLLEFVNTPPKKGKASSGGGSSVYKLYDHAENQVYDEAGSFTTPHLAYMKLDQLYKKDPEAYGDLGVIKYEGKDVYAINRKGSGFTKRKIG